MMYARTLKSIRFHLDFFFIFSYVHTIGIVQEAVKKSCCTNCFNSFNRVRHFEDLKRVLHRIFHGVG